MYYLKKRKHSKLSNAERIVRIFRLGAELQLYVHDNGITFRNNKLIVGPIKRYLRTLFMEPRPELPKKWLNANLPSL